MNLKELAYELSKPENKQAYDKALQALLKATSEALTKKQNEKLL